MKPPYGEGDELTVLAGKFAQSLNGQILRVVDCTFLPRISGFAVTARTKDGKGIFVDAVNTKAVERALYDVRAAATGELIRQFEDSPGAIAYRDVYASKHSIDVYVCLHKHGAQRWEYIREVSE